MQFLDISHDKQTVYRLKAGEKRVFFALNRGGELTFDLGGEGAAAHVFAFFIGNDRAETRLVIDQRHLAPSTVSRVLVKSVHLAPSTLEYRGTIHIAKHAAKSDASQESRSLLISPKSVAIAVPNLEILAHDVKCHHAATVGPLNKEQLFYAKSRGLDDQQAKQLLVTGFFGAAFEAMEELGITTDALRPAIATSLGFSNSREW